MTSNSGFRYSSMRKLRRGDVVPVPEDLHGVDAERGVLAEHDLLAERPGRVGLEELIEDLLALRVAARSSGPRGRRAARISAPLSSSRGAPRRSGSGRRDGTPAGRSSRRRPPARARSRACASRCGRRSPCGRPGARSTRAAPTSLKSRPLARRPRSSVSPTELRTTIRLSLLVIWRTSTWAPSTGLPLVTASTTKATIWSGRTSPRGSGPRRARGSARRARPERASTK